MGFVLPASFYGASSIKTGGSCWRSKQYAKNHYASSYLTTLCHKTGENKKEYRFMMSSQPNLRHHYRIMEGGSTCQENEKKYIVKATSKQTFEYEPHAQHSKSIWDSIKNAFDAFYRFSRPYAAIEAALGATSISFLAVEKLSDLSVVFFIGLLQVVVASFFMNIFHCGFNQLCDIEIDKINKPYLPLASGELSFRNSVLIVASSLMLCFGLAWIEGSWPLFWGFFVCAMLTAAYSINLPLLRWKKSSMLAAINIFVNAGVLRPLGYFLHMQTCVFKRPTTFPRPLIFCMAILSLFFVVIALFKDIPDTEGDKKFGIRSLSAQLGQKQVFWICISLLQMAYGITILAGVTSPFLWSKISMVLGHAILASILGYQVKSVDLKNNDALQSFYLFIWKLLTVEYCLIPLFR
uniref:Genistein 6-dimethylallyltransferase n=1 Tax=Sophora flavescens TaxID=49840 RepID=F8WPJ2_SOPFL|nr:genistein 6-dimethylallyltransferase [Sophora flavescens]